MESKRRFSTPEECIDVISALAGVAGTVSGEIEFDCDNPNFGSAMHKCTLEKRKDEIAISIFSSGDSGQLVAHTII